MVQLCGTESTCAYMHTPRPSDMEAAIPTVSMYLGTLISKCESRHYMNDIIQPQ